jgi:DNA-binding winged helix-turn-helix (wHTH) protein/tetratricopeptide (TPR) repeat protein
VTSGAFSFGEFRLYAARRELWQGERRIALPIRVFDCIEYLLRNRARAVGRDELMTAIWGRTAVADNLLDQVVLRARRALSDARGERAVIRTVPRFGYAWVAPVEIIDAAPASTHDAPRAASPVARRFPSRRWLAAAIGLSAVACIVAIGAMLRDRAIVPPTRADSVARTPLAIVMPLEIDGDSAFEWMRLGGMDLIASRLRKAGLPVVPSDNTMALLRGTHGESAAPDAAVLAKAAGATLVVSGLVEPAVGGWRVALRPAYGAASPAAGVGESQDIVAAARMAADELAVQLALPGAGRPPLAKDSALDALLQRSQAAILSDHMDAALRVLDQAPSDQRSLPEVRYQRAVIDLYSGRPETARQAFAAISDGVSATDDPLLRAKALKGLGMAEMRLADYTAADTAMSEAVALLDGESDPAARYQLGVVLSSRGGLRSVLHRPDDALFDFGRARVLLESSGDRLALTGLDSNIGVLEETRNRYAEAVPYFERAVREIAAFDVPNRELRIRENLAKARVLLLDSVAAGAEDLRFRTLIDEVADRQLAEYARVIRAWTLFAVGRTDEALQLLRALRQLPHDAGDEVRIAWASELEAEHALSIGADAKAADEATRTLKAHWDADYPQLYARAWLMLVRAELRQQQSDRARESSTALAAWAAKSPDDLARVYASLAKAEVTASENREDAASAFEQALADADAARVPFEILEVASAYLDFLVDKGDLGKATLVAERVSAWAPHNYDAALVQVRLYHALGQTGAWHAALERAQSLAGERIVPPGLAQAPSSTQEPDRRLGDRRTFGTLAR